MNTLRLSSSEGASRSHDQSLLKGATVNLLSTMRRCNPAYAYESQANPRRVLTKPSEPSYQSPYDNVNHDLIIHVNDIFSPDSPASGPRYRVVDLLGQGTFGQVVKCVHLGTGSSVAVKVIKNKPAYYNQGLVELKIVRQLNQDFDPEDTGHIVRLTDFFTHHGHLCLVFELLSINLYELIKMNQHRGFSMNLLRIFLKQIVEAQMVLDRAQIIHCDLKPENILLCDLSSPQIKLIDLGSACYEGRTVFSYIQSRFYRSPEVILGVPYTGSIDVWSIGCIAAELFFGLPLFPGHSECNQLSRIVEMMGPPPDWMLQQGKNTRKYYTTNGPPLITGAKARHYATPTYSLKSEDTVAYEAGQRPPRPSTTKKYFGQVGLAENIRVFPLKADLTPEQAAREHSSRQCLSHFLLGLLQMDPLLRWTPEQALEHPFITAAPFHPSWTPSKPRRSISRAVPVRPQGSGHGGSYQGHMGIDSSFSPRSHFQFQLGSSPSTSFSAMGSASSFIGQSPSTGGLMGPWSPSQTHQSMPKDRSFSLPTQQYCPDSGISGYAPLGTQSLYQKQYPAASESSGSRGNFFPVSGNAYPQKQAAPGTQSQSYRSQRQSQSSNLNRSGSGIPTAPFSPSRSPFKGGVAPPPAPGQTQTRSGKKSHKKTPSTGNYQSGYSRSSYSSNADPSGLTLSGDGSDSFYDDMSPSPSPRHSDGGEFETPFYFEDGEASPQSPTPNSSETPSQAAFGSRYRAQYESPGSPYTGTHPPRTHPEPLPESRPFDPTIFPFRPSEDPSWPGKSRRSGHG